MAMKQVSVSILVLFVLSGCRVALGETSEVSSLDACQRYATGYYQKVHPERFASIVLLEEKFTEEKYADKVGSQFISTVISGAGIWQNRTGGPSDIRFTCLLENSKTPVFFAILEDQPRDPADVCWDAFEPSEWGKITQCLADSLQREEATLAAVLNRVAQQAKQSLDKLSAERTLQQSNAQWIKYRDSECDRQQAAVAGRNHPDIGELTCKLRQTGARIADLQFDE